MLAIARRNTILEMLREQQSVNVTQLAAALGVATETIRRDLKELESSGQLIRTHGGAYITDGVQNDINVSARSVIRKQEKREIARKCAQLVQTGDSIFLDASTTDWCIAQELLEKNICEERLARAMKEINASAVYLYTLWVEPYLPAEWCWFQL